MRKPFASPVLRLFAPPALRSKICPPFRRLATGHSTYDPSKVRNVAIIAHVDHGKTTLMDKLISICNESLTHERSMDSNDHEKERGITIMSKYTRLHYDDHIFHIVDTPGHADFGGEVERVLSMVEGVVLLVDASEGPMSQTKFVLGKALEAKKKVVVVINKVDRENHRASEVENEIFDLFCNLCSDDVDLEYSVLYASAKQGWVVDNIESKNRIDVSPLLNKIMEDIPPPVAKEYKSKDDFAMNVNTIQKNAHLGRIVTGKIEIGSVSIGDKIKVLDLHGNKIGQESKVTKLSYFQGMQRIDVEEAFAGQIVSLAGCSGNVSDTVCAPLVEEPISTIPPSPPVVSMTFGPNSSPLAGQDGKMVTSSLIKNRLNEEVENNVTISLKPASDPECVEVQGRGELQIGILVETMRREGFELTVSPPNILTIEKDGETQEPVEEVILDVDHEYQGFMMENINKRSGEIEEIREIQDKLRIIFKAPSRGLLGFRHEALNATRGTATINSTFSHYEKVKPINLSGLKKGKLVSMATGASNAYALGMIQERGQLFIGPGEKVYEGLVIGECAKDNELDVNPCKQKKLTNIRTTLADEKVYLTTPKKMTVEELISYMDIDEVLEVTPTGIRLRKLILDSGERVRYNKSKAGRGLR